MLLLALFLAVSLGDVYMHNPRGSNNRLNGNGNDVDNNNRLFDSQVRGALFLNPFLVSYA